MRVHWKRKHWPALTISKLFMLSSYIKVTVNLTMENLCIDSEAASAYRRDDSHRENNWAVWIRWRLTCKWLGLKEKSICPSIILPKEPAMTSSGWSLAVPKQKGEKWWRKATDNAGPVNLAPNDYVLGQGMLKFYMVITLIVTFVIIAQDGHRHGNCAN